LSNVEVANGNQAAQEKLVPLVYDELKKLARRYMRRERADHTLQTTALVHEAYLKLVRQESPNWQGRAQLFLPKKASPPFQVVVHFPEVSSGLRLHY
jgi:DNA-directed RNA polymerase specialized sigma24 family protein